MAAKDLQIMRTRAVRVDEMAGTNNTPDGGSAGNPLEFILAALRRQWPLVAMAVLVSGTVAWFYSSEFATETVRCELQLQLEQMPVSRGDVYQPPIPDVASKLLMSRAVLEPVVLKNGSLPPVQYFARQLTVKPDARSGVLTIELLHDDQGKAIEALNDLGDEFVKMIVQVRKDTLAKHSDHTDELLRTVDKELKAVRKEFFDLQVSEQSNGDGLGQRNAELQGLVNSKNQLQAAVEQTEQQQLRTQREQADLVADKAKVLHDIYGNVLAGRRRQAEAVGRGLTSSARIADVKQKILSELTRLDAELAELISRPVTGDQKTLLDASAETVSSESVATTSEAPGAALIPKTPGVEAAPVLAADGVATSPTEDLATFEEESLLPWIERVLAAGRDTLGDLDPQTLAAIQLARAKLENLAESSKRLRRAAEYGSEDLERFRQKLSNLQVSLDRAGKQAVSVSTSIRGMEVASELTQKEAKYAQLSQQLERINQIKDWEFSEYIVSRQATAILGSETSDWTKLFVFALLGCGLVLMIPPTLVEWLRLRPSPVNVVSRRWNLPVLGVQSPNTNAKARSRTLCGTSQQELRLMALRIQQSLFRPEGRVVLFSGLDHEESPMGLIRSLANCFSQREESVLMIQSLPHQLETDAPKASGNHEQAIFHPGVAEFLAGEIEDASELVKRTGVVGVDFLPGGCSVTASEAMASSRLTELIDQFRERYSMILLCGPSTLHPADLQMVAARADGIVFTVNKRSLKTVYGAEVISDLIELGAPILGFTEQPLMGKKAFPSEKIEPDQRSSTAISA